MHKQSERDRKPHNEPRDRGHRSGHKKGHPVTHHAKGGYRKTGDGKKLPQNC